MIVSKDRIKATPRWMRAGVVVMALGLMPLGVGAFEATAAGPNEALAQELREAVEIGLPKEDAQLVYDRLVFPGSETARKLDAELASTIRKIEAAVASGRINQADADTKIRDVRAERDDNQAMAFRMEVLGMDRARASLSMNNKKIDRLVRAGTISPEQGERKKIEMREQVDRKVAGEKRAASRDDGGFDWGPVKQRIEGAVDRGEMTREQANEAYEGVKRRLEHARAEGGEHATRAPKELEKMQQQIEAAVERGELTREEANAKHLKIRERMAQQSRRGGERAESREGQQPDWDAMHARIEAAVESGDLTREEANAKHLQIRERRMRGAEREGGERAESRERAAMDWERVRQRIEGAVERGDLTREQADAKYREIRQRMAQGGKHAAPGVGSEVDWGMIRRRLAAAVESGDMTREEAGRVMEGIRRRAAQGEHGGEHSGGDR